MKRFKKILTGFILALASSFLLASFVLTPAFLKPIIEERVETLTGYQLRLDGTLSWHYFPHFGVTIGSLSLELPDESILTLKEVKLGLAFLPLLHKVFQPTQLTIDHVMYEFPHHGKIQLNHVNITQHTLTSHLYQGTLNIEGTVNIKPSFQFEAHTTLSNTALGPLLQDVTGKSYVTGTMSGESHVTGQSLATLNGDAKIRITQGELQFSDLSKIAQQALLVIGQAPASANLFDQITAQATIHDGIAQITSDLSANNYHAHGTGNTHFNDLSIDMMIHAYYKNNQTAIPIRIQGSLQHPETSIEFDQVLGKDLSTLANHLGQLFHS